MSSEDVIKELNAFLKGEFMAIHSYEYYIQHVSDPFIKKELQRIQQEHKKHAVKIAERVQNLGGKAVEDNGVMLSIREGMLNLKGFPDSVEGILKNAINGQEKGMKIAEEIVRGDLDLESRQTVEEILDEDRDHINQLNNLIP
ncbi:DUF2383 domain-containing protein [Gracilibacillus alcaliphilus]|uniref:DUF2383 domain-containing protein n=1 Tax=Gracilibacillus alcaliphilus TaxID=1401441 RepID=UPI00195778FF|nr:DUF2383 domain-containing protein [Gracilibacillus alcaliphilus]MBM7678806.1 bacterioferritin [Gracilibacillus alcaliphilus]